MVWVRGISIFEYITFSKYLFGRHGHSLIGPMLKTGAAAWGKQAADVIHKVQKAIDLLVDLESLLNSYVGY